MIQGKCHCGNVCLSVEKPTDNGTSCNCAICSRYVAIWGYFKRSEVDVQIGAAGVSDYQYGDKTIRFVRCNDCGCMTHYESTDATPTARLAVNYRMFPAELIAKINIKYFDGADTWKYLDTENK